MFIDLVTELTWDTKKRTFLGSECELPSSGRFACIFETAKAESASSAPGAELSFADDMVVEFEDLVKG